MRYYINPAPDYDGAYDELPNAICLDESIGDKYYSYYRRKYCKLKYHEIERGSWGIKWERGCSECGSSELKKQHRFCPNCGAEVIK